MKRRAVVCLTVTCSTLILASAAVDRGASGAPAVESPSLPLQGAIPAGPGREPRSVIGPARGLEILPSAIGPARRPETPPSAQSRAPGSIEPPPPARSEAARQAGLDAGSRAAAEPPRKVLTDPSDKSVPRSVQKP
jgi:hypothetical protein